MTNGEIAEMTAIRARDMKASYMMVYMTGLT